MPAPSFLNKDLNSKKAPLMRRLAAVHIFIGMLINMKEFFAADVNIY